MLTFCVMMWMRRTLIQDEMKGGACKYPVDSPDGYVVIQPLNLFHLLISLLNRSGCCGGPLQSRSCYMPD